MPTSSSETALLPKPPVVDPVALEAFLAGLVTAAHASAAVFKLHDQSNVLTAGAKIDVIAVFNHLETVLVNAERHPASVRVNTVTLDDVRLNTLALNSGLSVLVLARSSPWSDQEISLLEFIVKNSLAGLATDAQPRAHALGVGASTVNGSGPASPRRTNLSDPVPAQILTDAVERHQMHLVFQPELDLRTGEVLAVEALLRWDEPRLSAQRREDIIALAEQNGVMPALGDWVFEAACEQLAQWVAELVPFTWSVRINVSALQLNDEFVERVEKRLQQGDIVANLLCIELTEHSALSDPAELGEKLQRIRALGVKLALDDVGTGHNSLSRIKDTPLDILKIDRSFVTELDSHPFDQAIVEAILLLGRALHLEVVAEGVETVAVARALLKAGCWRAQGHLLQEAASAPQLQALLAAGRLVDSSLPFGAW